MTNERRADLALPTSPRRPRRIDDLDYVNDVLVATASLPQRRGRHPSSVGFRGAATRELRLGPRIPWRVLAVALIIIALLVASVVVLTGAASRQFAPPFGLARTGLVAFVTEGDLVATRPDGTGRRTLIAGDGVQWGLIWSHRGDRFAYWSATPAKTVRRPCGWQIATARTHTASPPTDLRTVPRVSRHQLVAGRPAARVRR